MICESIVNNACDKNQLKAIVGMKLIKQAWNSMSDEAALSIVENLTDETELARASQEAKSCKVRLTAIVRLVEQTQLLAQAVFTDAAKKAGDSELLLSAA